MILDSHKTLDQRRFNEPKFIEKRRAITEMWSLKEQHDPEKISKIIEIL